jgi:UDP-N-acetylmuramoyl-tripeptide--D-alanyl-D-alanine ligase
MAEKLWSAEELRAIGARFEPEPALNFSVNGVSIDSRTLKAGDLFVAIRGARDGHEFVAKALESAAAAAMVDHPVATGMARAPLLFVDDTLRGLERLAAKARERSPARRIAVTGSVGKTGTKEALRVALGASGPTHASEASYNNLWGVPLTLARMPRATRFGVFEIGMNHPGEIAPLSRQVRPHAAIITTVEPVHLEFFDSVEEIAEAKAEIFSGIEPGGFAILNRDNMHFERLALRAREAKVERIIGFGEDARADARLVAIELGPEGSSIRARIMGRDVSYRVASPGRHVACNSLAVLAGVVALGGDLDAAALALSELKPPPGRGARAEIRLAGGPITLIDESYNANPASMRAALANLALVAPRGGRRIAALGDMLELGPRAPELHAGLAEAIETAGIDLVFLSGPMMRHLYDRLPASRRGAYAPNSQVLADEVAARIAPGDAIMIKGSLGSRMKIIVDRLQQMDRAVAQPRKA